MHLVSLNIRGSVEKNDIFSLKWIYYGQKWGILDYRETLIFCLLSSYILSMDKGLQGLKDGYRQYITDSLTSVEYKNTTIPVNTIIFIVRDEVTCQYSYYDLRSYVESYAEQRLITSNRYI